MDGVRAFSASRYDVVRMPWAIVSASYERQKRNQGKTAIVSIPNRGHSLTIDSGWKEVADVALAFVSEHAPPK